MKTTRHNTALTPRRIALTIAVWGILLAWPLVFYDKDQGISWIRYCHYIVGMMTFASIYFVNYHFFIDRYLATKKFWRFACANLLFCLAVIFLSARIIEIFPEHPDLAPPRMINEAPPRLTSIRFICGALVVCTFVCALSISSKMTTNWYAADAQRKELERNHSEAELQNLKSQLNPHFLFNTLNNIYSMIAFSPERAQSAVHELSRMLRYVLYESSVPGVPVGKELDFVHNYVELMRIRLPKHVTLITGITTSNPNAHVAPLLFIAPVENAFKHGVSAGRPSFIDVNIAAGETTVKCKITNSLFPKDEGDKSGSGIGIANLRKRLELLYHNQYTLKNGADGDTWSCELTIPLSNQCS
jgi:hypothetical protein